MATTIVSSGQTSSGLIIGPSDSLIISGGTALDTTISSGGIDLIQAGGIGIDTVVSSGGAEFLYSAGTASDTTISAGGQQIVSGGASISAAVSAGGVIQTVDSGGLVGVASNATIFNGGTLLDSGAAIDTTIASGGTVTVFASGVARGTDVAAGGTLVIMPYALVKGTTAQPGADVIYADVLISSGYDTPVLSFGQRLSGGTISSGFTETVYSGGSTVATTIASGGYVDILSGGVTTATTVASGGYITIRPGGLTVGAVVQSGGDQYVASGGAAHQTQVQAGGEVTVHGFAELMTLDGSAQVRFGTALLTSIGAFGVLSADYGVVSRTTVGSGGELLVEFGGKAQTTTIESGGLALFLTSGSGDQFTVQAGGTLVAENGVGASLSGVVSAPGAQVFISTGAIVLENDTLIAATSGTLSGLVLSSALVEVRSGATTQALFLSGGQEDVGSGGVDSASQIGDGTYYYYERNPPPAEIVTDGGRVISDTVSGGNLNISAGGIAQGVTIAAVAAYYGNGMEVYAGGVASDTLIEGNNVVDVFSGGLVSDSIITANGIEEVFSGGFATGTVVSAGGLESIDSSGGSTDIHVLSGGEIRLNYLPIGNYPYSGYAVSTTLDSATDVLTVTAESQSTTVQLAGDYTSETFIGFSEGNSVLILAEGTPCYCRGTRILTATGEIPVEDLRIGDHLITKSGEPRALRWIGRRSYAGRFAAGNRDVLPVLFRAGSLGGGLPCRDLAVSPLHAMYIDDMLIPAACLVNRETILQVESVDQVDYFHLELDTHDVIIAEGALSETYIDDDNRGMFHNAAEHAARYPDAPHAAPAYCAPRVEDGDALHAIRRRLHGAPAPAPVPLRGGLDLVERHRVAGWAMADDGAPVRLRLLDNGVVLSEFTADLPRPDVRAAIGGDGCCGFSHIIEGGLAPDIAHLIQVQRAGDARQLSRSPWLLEALPRAAPADPTQLRGCLDEADRIQVQGWAHAGADPVDLHIIDNGVLIGRVLANRFRSDLAEANHADGRCAFAYRFPAPLYPAIRHVIEVRRATDGAALENSPLLIESANAFDTALQDAVAHAVAAIADHDRARVLSFLLTQTDRLKQHTADVHAHRTERAEFRQLRRRWGVNPATPSPALRVLVIDRDLPTPDRDAGSQAILSHMQALQRLGYQVSFVAAEQMAQSNPHLVDADITPCVAPYYSSVEDVLRRQSGCFDLIYLHRAEIAEAYLALSRRWMRKARIVYAVADLHHLRLARQAEIEQRPELHAQSRRLRLAECSAAAQADAVLTHSPYEAALLHKSVPQARVHVVPWHVPLHPTRTPFAKRRGLAFIANYAHAPNVDAARFLVEDIMPLVWARDPTLECRLAGSAMPPAIRALAAPQVLLLGHIPDLSTLFSQVRLTVAPLRYGAGIKGKVLASLAAGIPCAATPIAAEGLDLPPNLIAATPEHLAALILRLHRNRSANRTATRAGLALIAAANATDQIDSALSQAIGQSTRRAA